MLSPEKLHTCICIIVSMPVPRYLNAFGLRTENLTRERKKRQVRCRLPLWQFRVCNSTLKDKSELWKTWNLCVCVSLFLCLSLREPSLSWNHLDILNLNDLFRTRFKSEKGECVCMLMSPLGGLSGWAALGLCPLQ